MPPSITVSHLHWSTPDGRSILADLSLNFAAERTGIVGRNGVGKSTMLRLIAGDLTPRSGRIACDGRIATLRQTVQAACKTVQAAPGETIADLFGVADALALLRRAEAGAAEMDELAEADWTLEIRIAGALGRMGLVADPDRALDSLSGGQRTRAAMAAAIFAEPDFLLLDEPSNNLDRDGRAALLTLIAEWRAGLLLVSHDRELLEAMDAIVELTPLGATRYGGNYSAYRARKDVELAAAAHELSVAERQVAESARRAQVAVERKQRRDSVGKAKGARGDMPRILIGARKERAENSSGDGARLADRQRHEAAADAARAREKIARLETLSVAIAPTELAAGRTVLRIEGLSFGYGPDWAADRALFSDLSLAIVGPERVALTGANGAGKTTLLALIRGELTPWAGRIERPVPFAMLDQRMALLDPALSIADNFRALHPGVSDNDCHAALARFRFRAEAAHRIVGTLSGGQMIRAGLACVLGGATPPPLLILDEPTNHLDLDSIMAVEAGLRAYDGALLVVSHDAAFLDAVGVERWVEMQGGVER